MTPTNELSSRDEQTAPATAALAPLPCPFCGNPVAEQSFWFGSHPGGGSYHVFCLECSETEATNGPFRGALDEAVAAWNRRATASTTPASGNEQVAATRRQEPREAQKPASPQDRIDVEGLKAAAEKATPGPWTNTPARSIGCKLPMPDFHVAHIHVGPRENYGNALATAVMGGPGATGSSAEEVDANAAFIATANPAVVLALIAERAELIAQRAALVEMMGRLLDEAEDVFVCMADATGSLHLREPRRLQRLRPHQQDWLHGLRDLQGSWPRWGERVVSIARLANIAWDNGDMVEFDRLSCRDLDRTIAEMTDDEIVALVTPQTTAAAPTPSVVTIHEGQAARSLGRES